MKETLSVADLIARDGMPEIKDNKLDLSNKGFTDLEGLQSIEGIHNVRELDLSRFC